VGPRLRGVEIPVKKHKSQETVPTTSQLSQTTDVRRRRKVAKTSTAIAKYLEGTPDSFNDSEFRRGNALDFPDIPGEEHRDVALPQMYVLLVIPSIEIHTIIREKIKKKQRNQHPYNREQYFSGKQSNPYLDADRDAESAYIANRQYDPDDYKPDQQ
jgi:hypothetical protein